jgi:outer membrane protein assembly factor BamD (BamD/ComL family)
MTSVKSPKTSGSKKKPKPELTEEEKQELEEKANQIREQQAENQLELAKLFLENKKPDIALRRLKEIVADYSGSRQRQKPNL